MIRGLRKRERDKGSALVEFGLAVFTVLLVVFLIIDVARAAYAYDWVSDASKQATRFAMVRGKTCDPLLASYCAVGNLPRGAQSADVINFVDSLAIGIDTSQVTVISGCYVSGFATANPLPCTADTWVKVQVQYNFKFLSPLFVPLSWTMQSTSERTVQQ